MIVVVAAAAEAEAVSAIKEEVEEAWATESPEKATGRVMGKR